MKKKGKRKRFCITLCFSSYFLFDQFTMNNVRIFWLSNSDEEQQIAQTDCISDGQEKVSGKANWDIHWIFERHRNQTNKFLPTENKRTINFCEASLWHTMFHFQSEDSDESFELIEDVSFTERFAKSLWSLFWLGYHWMILSKLRLLLRRTNLDRVNSSTPVSIKFIENLGKDFHFPCVYAITVVDLTVQFDG